jgi:hypothetical protein
MRLPTADINVSGHLQPKWEMEMRLHKQVCGILQLGKNLASETFPARTGRWRRGESANSMLDAGNSAD